MLGQIEPGQSAPTINVLWKIARALEVTFSALVGPAKSTGSVLRLADAKYLSSSSGLFISRALFPSERPRRVEFYELQLAPHSQELAVAHPPGTTENLVVAAGEVELEFDGLLHRLAQGDAVYFDADGPHAYRNDGHETAIMYLVMTYASNLV